jgi:APA family basic amino acid/polyamine antiporter
VLRRRGLRGPYRTFGYPVTPILFILVSAWIAYAQIDQNPLESLVVLLVLVAGAVLYVFRGKPPATPKLPEARVERE